MERNHRIRDNHAREATSPVQEQWWAIRFTHFKRNGICRGEAEGRTMKKIGTQKFHICILIHHLQNSLCGFEFSPPKPPAQFPQYNQTFKLAHAHGMNSAGSLIVFSYAGLLDQMNANSPYDSVRSRIPVLEIHVTCRRSKLVHSKLISLFKWHIFKYRGSGTS